MYRFYFSISISIFLFGSILAHSESSAIGMKNRHFQIIEASTDYQHHILDYILKVFCKVRTIFMNVSIEKQVPFAFFNRVILTLSCFSSAGLILNG